MYVVSNQCATAPTNPTRMLKRKKKKKKSAIVHTWKVFIKHKPYSCKIKNVDECTQSCNKIWSVSPSICWILSTRKLNVNYWDKRLDKYFYTETCFDKYHTLVKYKSTLSAMMMYNECTHSCNKICSVYKPVWVSFIDTIVVILFYLFSFFFNAISL